jgi:hypothetical protein
MDWPTLCEKDRHPSAAHDSAPNSRIMAHNASQVNDGLLLLIVTIWGLFPSLIRIVSRLSRGAKTWPSSRTTLPRKREGGKVQFNRFCDQCGDFTWASFLSSGD